MKTAIVYDRVNKWGGAERVLLALHEMFPDAPLFTSVYSPEKATWAASFSEVTTSFLNKIKYLRTRNQLIPYLMPIAFETFDFTGYDLVISVTSEAAKGVITKPPTLHICYCLTPTRYLWSHYNSYFKGPSLQVTKPVVSYLRYWDKIAAQRPDVMVGISTEVQNRIKKYYERESELIYPPVDVNTIKNQISNIKNTNQKLKMNSAYDRKNYYLIVSRLVPYKRVDLAVEAFNELRLPLIIVGIGSEEKRLKSQAKENIRFFGLVGDEDLVGYYINAKALIFPQAEDFGMVAVEAQAMGCPVIAYKKGGALDTVIEGKTGTFFSMQTKESLIKALKYYDDSNQRSEMSQECVKNAQRFSKERFKKEFENLVEKNMSSHL
ncbi:hypothetical protein A2962_05070 [Candidatus Woesebacteria bacterium RIFCSPLOWO2_01_FULL_39_61]|uniref:Glycosyl transferase family 1 domain-containing protein n=1 Tax=Candidatus Woesebacteria bacterium RIFCSPHIGHO2_02_FULL_39_13 TaxID=1802505 RepID=A0A1F7Z0L3_9BACT|nr:MAG: hypothetical protein A2692_03320 [Candidatus Woesebacteria bacterium RIFCSPHIGHO2_01_FULL_39_95]OGM32639.1 MAG: hypothetical protein A3D01_05295 [Candidatus Woesebacteria bacterium RIFCSPHIGHO2_02_FULL_39_13]OGM36436.1 MAG: hypothetical protein A3E13_00840 [Candidatus Woesebacteria bacterium RIFCSPHIGHO2_12_FULL_40_20]OGM66707.1 MAG: hypothetical protein A2962_05070 [Candidatus Woesebacteria bacterium RIFCSPLOWO2_01_FULL_39_61]OGM73778.1 MAG: hypothetical protein A3H19_02590 [Candidatus